MMITINVNIPAIADLAGAIESLAAAWGEKSQQPIQQSAPQQSPAQQLPIHQVQPQPQPMQQAAPMQPSAAVPVQQAPMQQAPMQQPVAPTQPQQAPVQQPVPTTTQTYTQDQLAVAATQLMDAGKLQELHGLLQQFGVQALTQLPKGQYGAFATALRQMGAKI